MEKRQGALRPDASEVRPLPADQIINIKNRLPYLAVHPRGTIMKKILVYISMTVMLFTATSCDSPRLKSCKKAYEAAVRIGQDGKQSWGGYASQDAAERTFRIYYRTLDAKERQKMQRYADRTARKRQAQAERRARLTQEADQILSNINK